VLYAWEVQEHEPRPKVLDEENSFEKELTCSVCGKTWKKRYPLYAQDTITNFSKRCPECREAYRNADKTPLRAVLVDKKPVPSNMVPKVLKCEFCGRSFVKVYPKKQVDNITQFAKYCPDHKDSKNRKKKNSCPTPTKKKFSSRFEAQKKALSASRKYLHPVRVYPCPCGSWHMTVHRASNYGSAS